MAKKKKKPSKPSNPRVKKYKHFETGGGGAGASDWENNKKAEDNASVFDRKSSKQKFEILGRKIKGKSGNVLKARREGFERRERTLLVEHKLSGKANAFVDLRFGELDNNLTQEEKSIGRLARARLGQLRKKRKNTYSLEGNENDDDEDEDNGDSINKGNLMSLTHLGKPLNERRIANAKFDSDSDDEDGTRRLMNEEMTRRMHFGGGDFDDNKNGRDDDDNTGGFRRKERKSTAEDGDDDDDDGDKNGDEDTGMERRKTKKEVMDELIAKSKMYKAEKAKQRDDDEELLDKLDADFRVISQGGLLQGALRKAVGHLKPTNKNTSLNILQSGLPKEDDTKSDYDKIAKSLALDARAHAAEREKTSEQIEARQKRQLEEAERARLKRMRGDLSEDDEDDERRNGEDEDAPLGGYALRRHKARKLEKENGESCGQLSTARVGGEDLDDDFELGEDDDEIFEEEEDEDEDDEEDSDESDDDDVDDLDETGKFRKEANKMDEKLEKGKNRLRELGILNDGVEVKKKVEKSAKIHEGTGSDDDDDDDDDDDNDDDDDIMNREILFDDDSKEVSDDDDDDDNALKKSKEIKKKKDAKARDDLLRAEEAMEAGSSEIPYTFDVPETFEAFETLLTKYTSDEVSIVLTRMRVCNAPTLATENRRKIQMLLGLLLQRFETLCGKDNLPVADLNVITKHISEIATQVPFYAATAAKARIEKMGKRLQKALRLGETGLPPARTILLLGLFADIFSSTDKQHAVTTPASLYIGNVLSHCAVRSTNDANCAVVLCALASAYVVPAMRIFPEALNLLTAMVHASAENEKCKQTWNEGLPMHLQEQCGGSWLRPFAHTGNGKKSSSETIEVLSLAKLLSSRHRKKTKAAAESAAQERVAMLRYAISTLGNLIKPVQKVACAPEMLQKVQVALNRLMRSLKTFGKKDGAVYDGILKMCETMHNEICETKKSSVRLSLAWHTKSVEAIKQFNPMYEEDGFQKERDYDPNRERAENRKLKKELRKEARGTVRELRKDNQFMHHAREQEKAAEAEERDAKHKEVLSFLEKQENDFKSGGQGGLIVKNKRRAQGGASKNGNRRRF